MIVVPAESSMRSHTPDLSDNSKTHLNCGGRGSFTRLGPQASHGLDTRAASAWFLN